MRIATVALALLIGLLQYPLWLGKGSWLSVWEMDRRLDARKEANQTLVARNSALDAEVRDLKQGYGAIEERARVELGMIRNDEIFVQILPQAATATPPATGAPSLGRQHPPAPTAGDP